MADSHAKIQATYAEARQDGTARVTVVSINYGLEPDTSVESCIAATLPTSVMYTEAATTTTELHTAHHSLAATRVHRRQLLQRQINLTLTDQPLGIQ
jgi:hypothetical protein